MSSKQAVVWGGSDCSVCHIMIDQLLRAGFEVKVPDLKQLIDSPDLFAEITADHRQAIINRLGDQNGAMPVVTMAGNVLTMREVNELI